MCLQEVLKEIRNVQIAKEVDILELRASGHRGGEFDDDYLYRGYERRPCIDCNGCCDDCCCCTTLTCCCCGDDCCDCDCCDNYCCCCC